MKRDTLRINEPCHADWSTMGGDQKKRFCGDCSKHVHDLSSMTEPQAVAVLTTVEKPCVRYTCNTDGTVRFKPSRRVFLARAGMVAGGLIIGGTAAAAVIPQETGEACGEKSLLDKLSDAFWALFEEEPEPVMGQMAIEPIPELEPLMGEPAIDPEELEIMLGNIAEPIPEPDPEPMQPMMGRIAPSPIIEETE